MKMYIDIFGNSLLNSMLNFCWAEWLVHQRLFTLGELVSIIPPGVASPVQGAPDSPYPPGGGLVANGGRL